jgi:Helix-turn-helix domain
MSMTMVTHVRSRSKSTRSARHLLLVIASHVNPDTGWAWPSLDTLAQETALTRRHVIRLVAHLEALGELEVRRGHGRGHVNFYRVHLASAPEQATPGPSTGDRSGSKKVTSTPSIGARSEPKKVTSPTRKGDIGDREKVTWMSPESKREREKKDALPAPVSSLTPDKPEVYNPFWCDAHGFCHSERLPDRRPDCARER